MENINNVNSIESKKDLKLDSQLRHKALIGVCLGLLSAIVYSLAPLISNLSFRREQDYGNNTIATLIVTWQEILSAILMFAFYGPKNFINYFKILKEPKAWLVVFYGFLGGPIAMVFITLSAQFTFNGKGNTDGSIPNMILNLYVIFSAALSSWLFKIRQSKWCWIALALSMALILGLTIHFAVEQEIQTKSIIGIIFALIGALFYTMEVIGMYHLMQKTSLKLTDREAVSIKTTSSAILMIICMPFASLADSRSMYEGWEAFSVFDTWQIIIKFVTVGLMMGAARMMYYFCIKHANGVYAASTQLLMLFWTPILQYVLDAIRKAANIATSLDANNSVAISIDIPQAYYWIYVVPIILCLLVITFNDYILIAEKVGWKQMIRQFKVDNIKKH